MVLGAGDANIRLSCQQAFKFAILLCSWFNIGWLLSWWYASVGSVNYLSHSIYFNSLIYLWFQEQQAISSLTLQGILIF